MKRIIFISLTLLILLNSPIFAKPSDEELGFIDSVAALTYFTAWPSATFKGWKYKSLNPVYGGHDLLIRLTGESAFGGELWVDISFQFRNGTFSDIAVYQHNAILAPPFETSMTLGALALDLANEYSRANNAPSYTTSEGTTNVAAVCLKNELGKEVVFSYRWGTGEWKDVELSSDHNYYFWWNYPEGSQSSPDFQIKIDLDYTEKDIFREYILTRYATTTPVTCDKAYKYAFRFKSTNLVGVYDLSK